MSNSEIIIYQSQEGKTKVDVRFEDETVWLTIEQMAEIFSKSRSTINEHILHIFEEGELEKTSAVRKIGISDFSTKPTNFYNLDVVISVGYRVKSKQGTLFRIWATERIKEYIIKGFTMNDERLKEIGGGNYWRELLDRIRDIRSSEKVMYRQVLDIYATSIDYNPKSEESMHFFKVVQNKLHYAAHGNTAAEVIFDRADADKPFMGLTTFMGEIPIKSEVVIAKNYLTVEELKVLNNLVSGYFDFAEIQAMRHNQMRMVDYISHLDSILSATGEPLLHGAGRISHADAKDKAISEYRKYQVKTLSPVEQAYIDSISELKAATKRK
ncbi:MAG: virulence RhuM family protein [bacterium]